MIILETFGGVAFFIILGLVFLAMFARIISGGGRGTKYEELQSIYSTRQIARRDEKAYILDMIGGPECPDGTYSRRQQSMWDEYYRLDKIDKELTYQERNQLVEARGYLPDEIADIIEGER